MLLRVSISAGWKPPEMVVPAPRSCASRRRVLTDSRPLRTVSMNYRFRTTLLAVMVVGLALVSVDSAEAGLFSKLRCKLKCCKPAPSCCEPEPTCCEPAPEPCCAPEPTCCEPAPADCGCEAAAPCGCDEPAPCGCSEPAPCGCAEAAPCGCGEVVVESATVPSPADEPAPELDSVPEAPEAPEADAAPEAPVADEAASETL